MLRTLCTIFAILVAGVVVSQPPFFRLQGSIETSAAANLHCIFFDREGLLWMGTDAGLQSFDGYRTRCFRTDAYSPDVLPNNTVLCMAEDRDGGLWAGTYDGLVRLDKRTGRFRTYRLPGYWQRIINTLFCSSDGTVWVGTDMGLARYDKEKDTFHTYSPENVRATDLRGHPVAMPSYSVKSIVEDRRGELYVGTWSSGLFRFNPRTGIFVRYPRHNDMDSAFSLFIDSRGRLWIGTWGRGIERIDHPLEADSLGWKSFACDKRAFNIYYKLVEDTVSHTLWACSREGVSILDLEDENAGFTHLEYLDEERQEPLYASNDLACSGDGHIWIATQDRGIKHLNTRPSPFRYVSIRQEGQGTSFVDAIYTDDGRKFWLGLHPAGIAHWDRSSGSLQKNRQIDRMRGVDGRAFQAAMPSIVRRRNGEIWIANRSFGVIILPPGEEARLARQENSPFITDNYVNALHAAGDGRMWIGARGGVSLVEGDGRGRKVRMGNGPDDFSHCDVRGICEDSEGNVWIATENEGIIRVTPRGCGHYCPREGNYPVYDATNCFEDSRKRLWAISNSGGLFLYDRRADKFVPKNREYSIDGSRAYAINEDRGGNLWLSTDKALVKLSFPDRGTLPSVSGYSGEDGLESLKFMPNSTFRHGDELYFGTRDGFYIFAPEKVTAGGQKPGRLIVTDVYVDDRPLSALDSSTRSRIASAAPLYAREITLPPSVNKFAVEFALLSYSAQNQYSYYLEGYDEGWRTSDAALRQAVYENLPPGQYDLHLKAADSRGFWSELPYTVRVNILPPWYQTGWAWIAYFLLAAGVFYAVVYAYHSHLVTQNKLKMNQVFTNIAHELLTPLTVISASVDELRTEAPAYEKRYSVMQNNIMRLTRLLRQILEVRKSQEGRLRLQVSYGNLSDFVRKTCENIRPMAGGRPMDLQLGEIAGYFDSDKVDKILYNLLSNAIKYNKEGGQVGVRLAEKEGMAVLEISDEGIGIPKDKLDRLYTRFLDGDYRKMHAQGTGLGLALTYELVKLHHGHIDCRTRENRGTTFTITFPLHREAYADAEIEEKTVGSSKALVDDKPGGGAAPEETGRKEYTMLVAEDNEELLGLMTRLLGKRYRVLTAKDGQQAWNIVQREELDIVISDVMMPVMDGLELTRAIKSSTGYAQLPVILLTAKTTDEDRHEGYKAGADEYLAKPFRLAELQLRVDNIILNRERIRRRFRRQTELEPEAAHCSSPDGLFLERAIRCVREHLKEYDREAFARDMCVSSSTLYNRLRALTGQNISAFILSVRMKEACRIVRQRPDIRVGELAGEVGIATPKYFTKCFKEEFGMLPSEYIEKVKRGEA